MRFFKEDALLKRLFKKMKAFLKSASEHTRETEEAVRMAIHTVIDVAHIVSYLFMGYVVVKAVVAYLFTHTV